VRPVSLALAAALSAPASGCAPREARAPHLEPTTAWIVDPKVDGDVQELLVRAYDEELAFPFRVTTREGEMVVVKKPAELAALVADPSVLGIACAAASPAAPGDDAWRERVDPELRTIFAANSACFASVSLRFAREATAEDKVTLEGLGLVLKAFDARTAIAWVPVRALPALGAFELVAHVDRD